MIPSTTNKLLVAEDWKKLYQSFRNADFKSYDFETLRRTMINYLRENYPEDFNDYIDNSEYIALIDLIAFLGQNLSFRIDLNARENFIETAERRDSVLRLARLISYNVRRNVPASGFLKITSVLTTESVYDDSGKNLSNTIVGWNDPTNSNWYQQFVAILSATMLNQTVFGKPTNIGTIDGITVEQYNINTNTTGIPVYGFTKNVGGTSMAFELTSASFAGQSVIYEDMPLPGGAFNFIYKNDKKGNSSANTGFFVHFKQGTMASSTFTLSHPVPNELIGINVSNINESDVWLWQLSADGAYHKTPWKKVSAVTGNNVIYNSLTNADRNIYTVLTRENDQVDLSFADGSFGNLPAGSFKVYYRQSNGLTYTINPENLNNISVQMPYISKSGQQHTVTLVLSLQQSVSNSQRAESNDEIKLKAPQVYYTQNRMVTAEDYNISPLSVSSDILKVKSINRTSSGISKYYELSDVSGNYSYTNIFANDGILYRDNKESSFEFTVENLNAVAASVRSKVATVLQLPGMYAFYLDKYPRVVFPSETITCVSWKQVNKTTTQVKGYFTVNSVPIKVGTVKDDSTTKFLVPGALIKFKGPASTPYFTPNGRLTNVKSTNTTDYIWSQVITVSGDGDGYNHTGPLKDGTGPVQLTKVIPSGAIIEEIIPDFKDSLSSDFNIGIINLIVSRRNFGLSVDSNTRQWFVISDSNIDLANKFELTFQGDTSSTNKDSSWVLSFEWTGKRYIVRYRTVEYIFESSKETAFFVDDTVKNYDFTTNSLIKDSITVLSINTAPNSGLPLPSNYTWQVDSGFVEPDGYVEPKKVSVSFYDYNEDGQIDDPDAFRNIVAPDSLSDSMYIFFKKQADGTRYTVVDRSITLIEVYESEDRVSINEKIDGQLYYFYLTDVVKTYAADTNTFMLTPEYFVKVGRSNLKFQYVHNSGNERRIDPSKTNIIDVYLLSKSYDIAYRNWVSGQLLSEPSVPTTQSLESMYMSKMEDIKCISDEIVFHPARYKVLFGSNAIPALQATFKAVINPSRALSTKDLQTRILSAVQDFFRIENWDFGQTFNFSELSTYVMNVMDLDIINFVVVPNNNTSFGNLYQITCQSDEILISGATVDNISIINSLTASEMNIG